MFLHLGWGGVYMDNEEAAATIRDCFSTADQVVRAAQSVGSFQPGEHLTIVGSDFYGSYWLPPGESRRGKDAGPKDSLDDKPLAVLTGALNWLTSYREGKHSPLVMVVRRRPMTKTVKPAKANVRKDTSLIGAAGVHYVAYQFLKRGMLALPTVRNTPGTDLIVTSTDGMQHANIQVKATEHGTAKFWIICSAKKFSKLPFGPHDYYVLLRPRRAGDPVDGQPKEFEGFMLTAAEAKEEMAAHLQYWNDQRKEPKFNLCIYVDKGPRERKWGLPDRKLQWRERWHSWVISK
jgi:hypothetical protein